MELQSVWGWQPALYLFLGGMGAGAFIMAAVLYLKDRGRHGRIVCVSMWAATISLVVGLLLLLMELVTPMRGLLMWQSFSHFTSWMTYGAWGAFGAIVAFGVSALLATPRVYAWLAGKFSWFDARGRSIRDVFAVVGMILGAFVAFYTGMLLMASGSVPFWDTMLLPVLFTVSAFDTGVALVEVVAISQAKREALAAESKRFMERCVVVLVLIEAVVLTAFLGMALASDLSSAAGVAAAASATMFVSGQLAIWFWGLVVVAGLVLPFVMALRGLLVKADSGNAQNADHSEGVESERAPLVSDGGDVVGDASWTAKGARARSCEPGVDVPVLAGALGALVGGCALRFLVLAAGVHADVVAETIFKMIN